MSTEQWISVARVAAWTIVTAPFVIGGILFTALALST